jgi:TFIIF-interacting CTD phosphatase-like protein
MSSRSKLKVYLDIDSTLLHSHFDNAKLNYSELSPSIEGRLYLRCMMDPGDDEPKGVGKLEEYIIITRPHLFEFLEFLTENVSELHLWSAGQFRYVRNIENFLFPPHRAVAPKTVLTNRDCEVFADGSVIKDLNRHHDDLSQVLIIDDREDTFSKNSRNAIHIPRYEPEIDVGSIRAEDDALLKIMKWFRTSGVMTAEDVRDVPKPVF